MEINLSIDIQLKHSNKNELKTNWQNAKSWHPISPMIHFPAKAVDEVNGNPVMPFARQAMQYANT